MDKTEQKSNNVSNIVNDTIVHKVSNTENEAQRIAQRIRSVHNFLIEYKELEKKLKKLGYTVKDQGETLAIYKEVHI